MRNFAQATVEGGCSMTQTLLNFDAPAQRHSPTSVAAADSIRDHLPRLRQVVLDYIRACGPHGCTDAELIEGVGLGPNTPRPRRIELARAGLIVEAGTRLTPSGRQAVIWRTPCPT